MTVARHGIEAGPPPGFYDDEEPLAPPNDALEPKARADDAQQGGPNLTDTGNGWLFAEQHRERVRYCPPMNAWFIFDGQRWTRDETFQVKALAVQTVRSWVLQVERLPGELAEQMKRIYKHIHKSESNHAIEAMLKMAQTVKGMCILPHEFDVDPWLFNCASGTIDLTTGKVRPHDPKDLITKLSPVKYDPKATNKTWNMFKRQITGGDKELEQFLCRAAGYFLTGDTSEKCFFLAHSDVPSTGKSTFLDALACAMGDYAMSSDQTTWLRQPMASASQNRGDLTRLRGARLVISSEFEEDARFDEPLIKKVTGGDPITAMDKHEKAITYIPQFKILYASNFAPQFAANDGAMVSRIRRIPFIHHIEHKDPKVRETLMKPDIAGPAILRWMVAGCLDWRKNRLPTPKAVQVSNQEWQKDNDSLDGFFDAALKRAEPDVKLEFDDVYAIYSEWCKRQGIRHPMGNRKLAKRLRAEPYELKSKESNGKTYWLGVAKRGNDYAGQSRFNERWREN